MPTTPHQADQHSLSEKLDHYISAGGPDGFADTDLARAFGDRHQHDIHEPDGCSEEGDQTYPYGRQSYLDSVLFNNGDQAFAFCISKSFSSLTRSPRAIRIWPVASLTASSRALT